MVTLLELKHLIETSDRLSCKPTLFYSVNWFIFHDTFTIKLIDNLMIFEEVKIAPAICAVKISRKFKKEAIKCISLELKRRSISNKENSEKIIRDLLEAKL